MQSYIYWALFGMVGYSVTTLFTKLAERSGDVYSFVVLAVSTIIVPTFVLSIVAIRGELKPLIYDLEKGTFLWAVAAACAHRGGDVAVPCAVARAGQCGGADLRDVHRRRLAARRAVPWRADDLEQDRGPRCRRLRRDAGLDLGECPSLDETGAVEAFED
jgi:hypothetical protein